MRDAESAVLTELRLERKLCDVVIKVDDVEFDAHKIILCGCSSYFCTLFTGAWATSKKEVYTIPGISPEMMHLIINYAYTHSVPLTKHNVVDALAAADQFLVSGIVQACCVFLEDQLCLNNCIGILKLVNFYPLPELRRKVFLYVLHHFEDVALVSQEFLELSVQELAAIIEDDRLSVKQENTVFEAVLCWIHHRPDQRRGHISVLLPKVRLGLMTARYLQSNVFDNAVVKESIECVPILNDAMAAFTDFRTRSCSTSVYTNLLNRPRLPHTILLIAGGKDNSTAVTGLQAYDARADRWVTVNSEEIHRAHHGAAVLNNFVYLIGGCDTVSYLSTVQRFDIVTNRWHRVAPMKYSRCCVSVAVQDGCIYAIGGFNRHVYYNSVERYKPETNQWTMVAPMHSKRSGASATTLHGKVYICGGFNERRSLCSAEFYDPNTNTWTMISPMRSCRSGLGIVAYMGRIYAVGGNSTGSSHLRSAEAYNPRTNRWTHVPSMNNPRSYFGIEVVDDQLFVVGGYNGTSTLLTVERYDEEAGMWYGASNINVPCSGLGCVVLHGLYDIVENLFPRGPLTLPKMEKAAAGCL